MKFSFLNFLKIFRKFKLQEDSNIKILELIVYDKEKRISSQKI